MTSILLCLLVWPFVYAIRFRFSFLFYSLSAFKKQKCYYLTIVLTNRGVHQSYFDSMSQNNKALLFSDASYLNFLGDDFLRLLLCRYIFCDVVLRIHRAFKVRHKKRFRRDTLLWTRFSFTKSLSHQYKYFFFQFFLYA